MAVFFVTYEKLEFNSCPCSVKIEAKNLTAAKRWATRMQASPHSVLEIRDQAGTILCWKTPGSRWFDL